MALQVDDMSTHLDDLTAFMPKVAPLAMPVQDLSKPFTDLNAPPLVSLRNTWIYRAATFLPAALTSLALVAIIMDWFRKDGFVITEIIMIALAGFSAFWIALSVASSTLGLFFARATNPAAQSNSCSAMNVALLIPVYNEDADAVFARMRAMRDDLARASTNHRYAIFLLSDTGDEVIAHREAVLFAQSRHSGSADVPVFYRRRAFNSERKTGNVRDWVEGWGAGWDAFVMLDADSLMAAVSINRLADEMVAAPDTGLIQTIPRLIGAKSVFARVQQFANNVYGGVLSRGLDLWSGHEGNYWGHNAIIRTRAFATCAGLPVLPGTGALGGTIKSHDFVEAALLRRAGWSVRLMPHLSQSYEETPQTIVDYVLRDRRWCQGNLQHLRLLFSSGFRGASRFHMLQGAMAYISSVAWFLLLLVWALMGRGEQNNVFNYFADSNPLFPQWPEMDMVSRLVVLTFMLCLLLIPKLFGMILTFRCDPTLAKMGGRSAFLVSAASEVLLSFVLAPILMVQHVSAVFRTIAGLDAGWTPQNRAGGNYSLAMLIRFHALETFVGGLLMGGIAAGVVSFWLVPVAISLVGSVPFSRWFGRTLRKQPSMWGILDTEEQLAPSRIIQSCNA
jgi:membrane glycosyltransferase